MVSSAKKKRGKQRKAAKSTRAAAGDRSGDILEQTISTNDSNYDIFNRLGALGLNLLERGHNKGTLLLTEPDTTNDSFPSGALSIILNLLKKCEHESFIQVMNSVRIEDDRFHGANGGDLESPVIWIDILDKASSME